LPPTIVGDEDSVLSIDRRGACVAVPMPASLDQSILGRKIRGGGSLERFSSVLHEKGGI